MHKISRKNALFWFFTLASIIAQAGEVKRFEVDVFLQPNGELLVEEYMLVKHYVQPPNGTLGRSYPLLQQVDGENMSIPFELLSAGNSLGGGNIRFWQEMDFMLVTFPVQWSKVPDDGLVEYALRYKTDRALQYMDGMYQFYLDVFGVSMPYEVDGTVVRLHLPAEVAMRDMSLRAQIPVRLGDVEIDKTLENKGIAKGAQRANLEMLKKQMKKMKGDYRLETSSIFKKINDSTYKGVFENSLSEKARVEMVGTLLPQNGGIQPGFTLWWKHLYADNTIILNCLGVLLLMMLITVIFLNRLDITGVGKNVAIQTSPPQNVDPGLAAYVWHKQHTSSGVEASCLHLALHGHIKIDHDTENERITLEEVSKPPQSFSFLERELFDTLFHKTDEVTLSKYGNNPLLTQTAKWHKTVLDDENEDEPLEKEYILPVMLMALPSIIVLVLGFNFYMPYNNFMSYLIMAGASLLLGMLVFTALLRRAMLQSIGKAILVSIAALALTGFCIAIFSAFFPLVEVIPTMMVFLSIGLAYRLFYTYTPKGRKILRHLTGLRRYLQTFRPAPKANAKEAISTYLPYAVAIDQGTTCLEKMRMVYPDSHEELETISVDGEPITVYQMLRKPGMELTDYLTKAIAASWANEYKGGDRYYQFNTARYH